MKCAHCKQTIPAEAMPAEFEFSDGVDRFYQCPNCFHCYVSGREYDEFAGNEPKRFWRPSAPEFLEAAANHMRNRAAQRDAPEGERSMAKTVAAFNATYSLQLTEEMGWMFMVFLKASRSSHGVYVQDDYEDGSAYFALAGESAARDRNSPHE